jgi:hypothetical protein
MDVIEDTDLAIQAFRDPRKKTLRNDPGFMYLKTYGVLQALFLQQDATKHLAGCFGIEEQSLSSSRLREVRNDSIGHPTARKERKVKTAKIPESVHMISRITMSERGFEYLSDFDDGRTKSKKVDFPQMFAKQEAAIAHDLSIIIMKAEDDIRTHKSKFRDKRLADRLPDSLGYSIEKIILATCTSDEKKVGLFNLEYLLKQLDELRSSLDERGVRLDDEPVEDCYSYLDHVGTFLANYFGGPSNQAPRGDDKSAYIFARHLRDRVEELRKIASEIDRYYEEP